MKYTIATALVSTAVLAVTPALAQQNIYEETSRQQPVGADAPAAAAGAPGPATTGPAPAPAPMAATAPAPTGAPGTIYAPAFDEPSIGPGGIGTENAVGQTAVDKRVPGGAYSVAYISEEGATPVSDPAPTAAPAAQTPGVTPPESAAGELSRTPDARATAAPAREPSADGGFSAEAQGDF